MNALLALLVRDMRISVRVGGGALMGALFFLIVVVMTPFAVGPDLKLLALIGPAILWLGALLAACSRSTACFPPTMTMARSIFS